MVNNEIIKRNISEDHESESFVRYILFVNVIADIVTEKKENSISGLFIKWTMHCSDGI